MNTSKKWKFAIYDDLLEFTGSVKEDGSIAFFNVRLGNHESNKIDKSSKFIFYWNEKKYILCDLKESDLVEMGAVTKLNEIGNQIITSSFLSDLNESNPNYGVEFYFRDGDIYYFYAWKNPENSLSCPFKISMNNNTPISFPFKIDELEKAFGKPRSIVSVKAH